MITEQCRMSIRDMVLVFLAAFVLVSCMMAPTTPLQTVIVSSDEGEKVSYTVPVNHRDLVSIRNRLESYGEIVDHPLLGTNRWIAETSRFYVKAAQPLWQHHNTSTATSGAKIRQVSHQSSVTVSMEPHHPASRSWNRIASAADARIDQIERHQSIQSQNLGPAPVKLGSVVNVYWTRTSLLTALIVGLSMTGCVAIWKRFYPTRQFQQLSVSQPVLTGTDHQWIALEVLPQWVRLHQTNGAILRRGFVAVLVVSSIVSLA
ncbi:hypothetical protein LF1_00810 [Rubripirellula obstinata]|uniref:Uncharacterized protein n=1 Tax=Rubripirellula obstinata TaxID=406547 RepID=A0A5B1CE21_9BACT|nr:hypothetical protein [Rubripirellula obstinata]KAA1257594.1 hypothetical protein LF1_00810 [Rubripirellula obstinata]